MVAPPHTAAIIGLNWGLVHLRGLREAGCEVVALAAQDGNKAAAAAAKESVPRGTSDVASLNDVDLVVIATPPETHAEMVAARPAPWLICEKPLLGVENRRDLLPDAPDRLLVNYAFGFLATARQAAGIVAQLGPPDGVDLQLGVQLPRQFTSEQWFLETTSHPLSWLLHLFGPPTVLSRNITATEVSLELQAGHVPVSVQMTLGREAGIHHHIRLRWAGRHLTIDGRYRPGQLWRYDPMLLDGVPVNAGEWSPSDCWFDANAASVRAMIAVFRREREWSAGLADGLFDPAKALLVESVLLDPISSPSAPPRPGTTATQR